MPGGVDTDNGCMTHTSPDFWRQCGQATLAETDPRHLRQAGMLQNLPNLRFGNNTHAHLAIG